ncbi:IclR family transcriptional regulator [Micromonospora sp. NPDC047740]|uniref:IclR family transcriptional regulator n=1 Tax=Micromonospora sp. NPDC047740 TaxID=3364254 RepID=UPI003715AB09
MTSNNQPSGVDPDLDRRAGTLERGLAILEMLSAGGPVAANEIIEELGLSRSATYRILGLLRQRGYLDWDGSADRIQLGEQVVKLGMAALASFDPFVAAQAYLRDLSSELSEAALMAVRDGTQMVYIAHEDVTDNLIAVRRLLGVRRPLHATSLGKAYLAALPIDEADAVVDQLSLVSLTPTTITDRARLRAELDEARVRGYAVDNGENEPDVMCFGAAIRDDHGRPVCAISVAGPRDRIAEKRDVIPVRVTEVALSVSRRLGFHAAPDTVPFRR